MTVQNDFPLSQILWYKIGGKAQYLLTCANQQDIEEALEFIKNNDIATVFVCGLGSNLIFTDEYFEGAVLQLTHTKDTPPIRIDENGSVEVFAGDLLDDLITFCIDHNLVGLEWAGGLPGTVGAAVRGNVGAFGGEIKDTLVEATVLDYSSEEPVVKTLTNAELSFSYRESYVKTHRKLLVISAKFELKKGDIQTLQAAQETYTRNKQFRKDRHPLEYPNCGSVFKNLRDKQQIEKVLLVYPELSENVSKKWYGKVAVASLIEKLGLKGYRVGDAQVSEKHALFIVNLGQATAENVLQVISDIQEKFKSKFGFHLELEVEVVK